MSFKRSIIPLNLNLESVESTNSAPFLLPPCSDFSLQIFSALSQSVNTAVSLEQSNDGVNFDPVVDLSGNNVQIEINDDTPTATLNVSNLCTVWLRLMVTPPEGEGESGTVSYLILTSN
jgi:hypothetical protein